MMLSKLDTLTKNHCLVENIDKNWWHKALDIVSNWFAEEHKLTFEQPGVDNVKHTRKENYMFTYNHFLTNEDDFLI